MLSACPYCATEVPSTWWDDVIALPLECPNCGAFSGPRWTLGRILILAFTSLILNALVFFFIAKPKKALVLIAMHVATSAALLANATRSDAMMFTAILCTMLGPACIVAIEYCFHQIAVARGPRWAVMVIDEQEPRFLGVAELEQLRNELEIGIHHHADALRSATRLAYLVCVLAALLAQRDWLRIAAAIVLAGCAWTTREHESRVFAMVFMLGAFAFIGQWSALLGLFLIGVILCRTTFALHSLRRSRSRIPLPPAGHLRD